MHHRHHAPVLAALCLVLAGVLVLGSPARRVAAAPGLGEGTACFPGTLTTSFGYTVYASCSTETTLDGGTVRVTFHARVAAPSVVPSVSVALTGFRCLTSRGPTAESVVTITPTGQVDGRCTYRP